MSSIDDVQNAMVGVITPAIYPNGTSNPSIVGANVYVAPGDFLKEEIDAGLLLGYSYVEVFAINAMTRSTTRLRRAYVDPVINPPTLTLTTVGNVVTVGGTITAGEAAMVIVHGTGYATKVLLGSTTTTIAAALAALIPGATSVGPVLTTTDYRTVARVSTQGVARQILFSREAVVRVRVKAPNASKRNTIANAIDLAFGINGYYLQMPDLIAASIKPRSMAENNMMELANLLFRDLLYLVEYHTVEVHTYQTIADPYVLLN